MSTKTKTTTKPVCLHSRNLAVGVGLAAAVTIALMPFAVRAQQGQLPTIVVTDEGEQQNTLSAQQDDGGTTVNEKIVGGTDRAAQTEGVNSYTTGETTVGTKGPASIRDIPRTTNVITRQQLDDQNLNSIERALEWDPGIVVATGNLFYSSFYARGHEIFSYSIDGMTRPLQSIYGTTPDLSFFDRVEVLSGPGTLFNGSGEPGAALNLARKRAGPVSHATASFTGGMWDHYRGEFDINTPLNDSGTVRARVVGFGLDEGSFIDHANQQRIGAYGTLEFDITRTTTLSLGMFGDEQDVSSTSGLPTFTNGKLVDVSRSSYVGADWNMNDSRSKEHFVELDHIFQNDARFHAAYRRNDRDTDILTALGLTGVDSTTGNFDMFAFARNFEETNDALDSYVALPFKMFGTENEIIVGADYRNSDQYFEQNFIFFDQPTNNIYNLTKYFPEPVVTFPGVGPGFSLNQSTEFNETGLYGQLKLKPVEPVTVLLGGRATYFENTITDEGRGLVNKIDEDDTTGNAGILIDVTPNATLYGSYAQIFQPQTEAGADGNPIGARSGYQYEVGIKKSLLNDQVNFQAAWFNLEDTNRAVNDGIGTFAATGDVRTRGVDVRIGGNPMRGLKMTAGYVFTDTENLSDDPLAEFGEIAPRHSASLFMKYTFQDGPLRGLGIGGGARGVSDFFSIYVDGTTVTRIEAPGYIVADAQVSYNISEKVQAQLDVTNVFDKKYYQRVNETIRGNFYGEPTRVIFRITARR
ncbi:MAG: TonB-dependent siderophore receptor [Hyphomicrobiaceae bacterium]|nr:TonB-dependent siderophore receptor [Hyphomicrobiaceae bacterium]